MPVMNDKLLSVFGGKLVGHRLRCALLAWRCCLRRWAGVRQGTSCRTPRQAQRSGCPTTLARPTTFLLPLLLLTLSTCGRGPEEQQQQQRPPAQVRTAEATEKSLTFYDEYPATVTALDQVQVRPQVAGYVTGIHFKEGDYVRRGQRLYTIDVRRYVADVEQARTQVGTAEANLALAEKNVARYRRLAEAEAIALQTLDQSEAELEARRQELERARAGVRSAETQLDYTVVTAPLSGVTSLNSVKRGTQVSPGNPVLTTISQEKPVGVDFSLPQEMIPRLSRFERDGLPADSTFRLRLPNDSLYQYYGRLYASDRDVDPRTGTLNVRLEFDNPDNVLRTGMSLEVEMLNQQSGRQLMVPTQALGDQMGEYYVFTVSEQDSMAHRQKVRTGAQIRDETVILEGLEAGARVITEGLKNVRDSAKVVVNQ